MIEHFKNQLTELIAARLIDTLKKSYTAGIASVVKKNKYTILHGRYAEPTTERLTLPRELFRVDWSASDRMALEIFSKEAFKVAGVGVYELEQELKRLAVNIQQGNIKKINKTTGEETTADPLKAFSHLAQKKIEEYYPTKKSSIGVPPRAWLKTNLQTAVTGAFHSAQRTRLQDPGLAGLYPAWKYMTRMDGAVRPEHMTLHGKVYYANDPIWSVIYPPNGWNCRCYVMPLSDYELKADNITPEELQSTKTPERKALIKEADINPDFINNPNSIWGKWLKDKFKDMPPHVVYDINRKAEDKFKTSGDSGSLSKDKTPPLDYEKHIDSTEKSLLRGCEIRYKEKPSNQPGSTEISYDFKTAKVELSESAVDKPATFKHEIGHIVSVVNGNLHLTKDFREVLLNKQEIYRILDARMKRYLDAEAYSVYRNEDFKTRKAFLTGGGVAEKGKLISLNKSNLGYLYKNSELFAEAYSQYKLNPDFKKVNPKLYKYFIIMENTGNKVNYKEGKNFSGVSYEEDGNKWIRISYSYGELKEMFEKKFGYKDIDNLPPEDEDRVAEEFNKFMDSLGM